MSIAKTLEQLRKGLEIDETRMHEERLARARAQLRASGQAAALLFDPLNVRYTTAEGFAQVSSLHYTWRWALVPVESDPILWDYEDVIPLVQERWPGGDIRPGDDWHFFLSGPGDVEAARAFAEEIRDVLRERGIDHEVIGVDRCEALAFLALQAVGIRIADAQRPLETARAVKTRDEVEALRYSARVVDTAIERLREAIVPGVTENELFGAFTGETLKLGALYNDARLVVAGPRTNPWLNESSDAVVENGDLVAFDTDLIGPRGAFIDISRTYLCGDKPATHEQRRLFAVAYEFLQAAMPELRPGATFAELGELIAPRLAEEFNALRYGMIAHGAGAQDEYPVIKFEKNYEGRVEAGMVLSVESYAGVPGGREGVKLEEQILVTDEGYEVFSAAPYDERLM